jgi:nucleoside-diphosphate-sugar epimerase
MNILLTGAGGFIGTGLVDRLVRERELSLRATYRNSGRSFPANVDAIRIGELGAATDWRRALAGIGVVVHAAARVHVMRETAPDPLAAYREVNTAGTLNLARQAAAAGVRRFVFLSTIKVNGERSAPGRPFSADDEPAPVDPYAISKLEAEIGLRQIAAESGLEIVILRPPLVYGPGVRGNFARLVRAVGAGRLLPFGAIDNRRSLVALDNLVDLIAVCIDHPAAAGRVLLVSDDQDLSTPELIRSIARIMDRPARLLPVPAALLMLAATLAGKRAVLERLTESLQVDIRKTRDLLAWKPVTTIDEGLRKTVASLIDPLSP